MRLHELFETIRKVDGDRYRLYSKSGKNLGTYDSRAGAEKRERQVQYFKHQNESENLPSVETLDPQAIAEKHGVPLEQIMSELDMGVRVEAEHTTDKDTAREIALDHLLELPDYYTRLADMENQGKLQEAFDKPYPVKVNKTEKGNYKAFVKLPDGTDMEILFANYGDMWDMEFRRGGSQDVTGEGDAFRVFATMMSAVRQFIQMEKPGVVSFTATKDVPEGQDPESRAKLYTRMVERFADRLGYQAYIDDYGDMVEYELVAKRQMEEGTVLNFPTKTRYSAMSDQEILDLAKEKMRIVMARDDSGNLDAIPEDQILNDLYDVIARRHGDDVAEAEWERMEDQFYVDEGNRAQLGIPANATDAELGAARKAGGKKGQRAHWLLNMRKGNRNK